MEILLSTTWSEIDEISSLLRHLSHYYHPLHKSRERIAERTMVLTE